MIDTIYAQQAKESSPAIRSIDESWRSFVRSLKENIFALPFKGNYSFLTEDNNVLVEGYGGALLINKVYFRHKTYVLKNPIKQEHVKVFGVFDNKGHFDCFVMRPGVGFHFLGMNCHGHSICTGDIRFTPPTSPDSLKEIADQIIRSFRVINMESLGTVLLPDEYAELRTVFDDRNTSSATKVEQLINAGLIETIL